MCARPVKLVGDGSEANGVQDGTLCLQPSSVATPAGLGDAQKIEPRRRPGLAQHAHHQFFKATQN